MAKGSKQLLGAPMEYYKKLAKIENTVFIIYSIVVTIFVSIITVSIATRLITISYVLPYFVTGTIGLYAVIKESLRATNIYIGFLLVSVFLNVAAVIISIVYVVILGIDYSNQTCESSLDENCSFNEVVIIVLIIMLSLNMIVSTCLLILCYPSYKHARTLKNMFRSMLNPNIMR